MNRKLKGLCKIIEVMQYIWCTGCQARVMLSWMSMSLEVVCLAAIIHRLNMCLKQTNVDPPSVLETLLTPCDPSYFCNGTSAVKVRHARSFTVHSQLFKCSVDLLVSASFLAEISVKSPRKLLIFII